MYYQPQKPIEPVKYINTQKLNRPSYHISHQTIKISVKNPSSTETNIKPFQEPLFPQYKKKESDIFYLTERNTISYIISNRNSTTCSMYRGQPHKTTTPEIKRIVQHNPTKKQKTSENQQKSNPRKKKVKNGTYLEKSGGIADVVPDGTLGGNSDLILVYRRLGLGFLDPLVPIHDRFLDLSRFQEEKPSIALKPQQREGEEKLGGFAFQIYQIKTTATEIGLQ